jgi:hypothetical protein
VSPYQSFRVPPVPENDTLACVLSLIRRAGLEANARDWNSGDADLEVPQAGRSLVRRVGRPNAFYLLCCSPAVSSDSSSAFCQLELGLYSFMALARTSVFLPRSF